MTISEYEVFEALQKTIQENIKDYYDQYKYPEALYEIPHKCVVIGYPEIDHLPGSLSIFINPDYGEMEPLTTRSDLETQRVVISIFCKGASTEDLVKKVFGYYTALYLAISNNPTLKGAVDNCHLTDWDYYPAVGAATGTTCIEVNAEIQWQKSH